MIKDILVNLAVDTDRDVACNYAVSVAKAFEAHLTGIAFFYEPIELGAVFDTLPSALIAAERKSNEEAAQKAARAFDEAARREAIEAHSRIHTASIADCANVFGRMGRTHDLSVLAQTHPDASLPNDMILEAALFESGRPVLVVPYIQTAPLKLDRVLLCWDGSRNAARAIADALPLLRKSAEIEVVSVSTRDNTRGELPGADVGHHLARHQLKVNFKRIVAPDTDVANTILSYAADSSADLIVMGGYGHSRLREFVLGGATRDMLASMTVPTLMSH
jgi:nucleotide-binding universal stress UspA family protein